MNRLDETLTGERRIDHPIVREWEDINIKSSITLREYNEQNKLIKEEIDGRYLKTIEYDSSGSIIKSKIKGIIELMKRYPRNEVESSYWEEHEKIYRYTDDRNYTIEHIFTSGDNHLKRTDEYKNGLLVQSKGFKDVYIMEYNTDNKLIYSERRRGVGNDEEEVIKEWYEYDTNNNRIKVKNSLDFIIVYTYDERNNRIRTEHIDSKGVSIIGISRYDENDNLIYDNDTNGNTRTFSYDDKGRVSQIVYLNDHLEKQLVGHGDIDIYRFEYDHSSNIIHQTQISRTIRSQVTIDETHEYDEFNNMIKTTTKTATVNV